MKALAREIKEKYPDKNIWLYTGDVWENVRKSSLMKYIDVLVDGEFIQEQKDATLLWKGSSNQRVIHVQATLAQPDSLVPILHCGDHDDIPMGRETTGMSEQNIIPFSANGSCAIKKNACEA